jgi:hypothetical protein
VEVASDPATLDLPDLDEPLLGSARRLISSSARLRAEMSCA